MSSRTTSLALVCAVLVALLAFAPGGHGAARIKASEQTFDFKTVTVDDPVTHTFSIENIGDEVVQITNVLVTAPLFFKNVRAKIPPGEKAHLTVLLKTPRELGEYDGTVEVFFKNPGLTNLVFTVKGKLVPRIEILPRPVLFVATSRHQTNVARLDIINHEADPLAITQIQQTSARFTTEFKAVEPGRRYALALTLRGEGPAGKQTDSIFLYTTSQKDPVLTIQANTYIKERVYTFPDRIDFGLVRPREIVAHPNLTNYLNQTLMVYQTGGKDFRITPETGLLFLKLSATRSKFQDRYEIVLSLLPAQLQPGPFSGAVVIETNDPEFSRLQVPVIGTVQE